MQSSKRDAKHRFVRKWKRRSRTRTAPIAALSRTAKASAGGGAGRVGGGHVRRQLQRASRREETLKQRMLKRAANQVVRRATRELTRSPQRVNFHLPAGGNPPPAAMPAALL